MNSDALLMVFLSGATAFLYAEKMRFLPAKGIVLWAWRLMYFGAALAFLAGAIFFSFKEKISEMPIARDLLMTSLVVFGIMISAGFSLFFVASKQRRD